MSCSQRKSAQMKWNSPCRWACLCIVVIGIISLVSDITIRVSTRHFSFTLPWTRGYVATRTARPSSAHDLHRPVENVNTSGAKQHLLLATYMRGGSSFTGELFNHNPDVFYWFEPLAPLFDEMLDATVDSRNWFIHDNLIQRDFEADWTKTFFSVLEDIFHCKITQLPRSVLKHKFATNAYWNKSLGLESYRRCLHQREYRGKTLDERVSICAVLAEQRCRNSSVRVIKTVRMNMDLVEDYIFDYPDVNLVYVVRDPRAILNSRWTSSRDHRVANYKLDAELLCMQMLYDSNTKYLLDHYYRVPEQVTTVRYEDLILNSTKAIGELYKSVGLGAVPKEVEYWVESATSSAADNGPLGTRKKNGTASVSRWTRELSAELQRFIEDECMDFMFEYGYQLVDN